MSARVHLSLCGAMDHLRVTWQAGETLLESIPFRQDPEGTRYNVLLAVQEMLTNVLRHGYGGAEHLPVEVTLEYDELAFAVEIRDRGPEFNPVAVELDHPDREVDGRELPDGGGYGILIAKLVMDDLEYRREGVCNVLRMTKAVAVPTTSRV